MENNYTGIQHHEGLLGIRNHPAMYVGSTNKVSENHAPKALTQLAQEVLLRAVADKYKKGRAFSKFKKEQITYLLNEMKQEKLTIKQAQKQLVIIIKNEIKKLT